MVLVRVLKKTPNFSPEKLSEIGLKDDIQTYDLGNYIAFTINTPEGERKTRKKILSCGCRRIRLDNTIMLYLIDKLGKKYEFRDFEYGLDTFNRTNIEDSEENLEYYQVIFDYLAHKQTIADVVKSIKKSQDEWEADIVEITVNENIHLNELVEIYRNLIFKIPILRKETASLDFIKEVLQTISETQKDAR